MAVADTVAAGEIATDPREQLVLATISGKMLKRWARIAVGDRVKMEMSPCDFDEACIIRSLK